MKTFDKSNHSFVSVVAALCLLSAGAISVPGQKPDTQTGPKGTEPRSIG